MKNNIMKKTIKAFTFLAALLAFTSCEVGLGKAVDMKAPTVKVSNPENTGFILRTFTVQGVAEDDTGVTALSLAIEPLDNPTEANSYKFRIENRKWQYYDVSTTNWIDYDTSLCSVSGSSRSMKWSLTYNLDPSQVINGTEFMITTQVYDQLGNESKGSKDERSVTVDTTDPVVSLISPVTVKNYGSIQTAAGTYTLKDNNVLANLINGEFEVTGSQKEEGKLDKLFVYLDDKTTDSLDGYDEGYILKKEVKGDNLRNWAAKFKLSDVAGYADTNEPKIVRIVTESHDQAGNVDIRCHGWFTYWNNADEPWVVADFGGDSYANKVSVYPNCALQGQSYDDDGIKKLAIKVYKNFETTPVGSYEYDLSSENYPKYKAWSVNALGTNCDFNVVCWCQDINGKTSQTVTRYMAVTDINPPNIFISTDTTQTMFGDANGKVNISGYVTDDGGISKLCLARIKEGTDADTIIQYYNSDYAQWNKATANGAVDDNGNKIWLLPLTDASSDTPGIVKKTFTRDFNIFSEFGINGTTEHLKTQTFLIMAVDAGATENDKGCANIDSFTWAGDTHAPEIAITNLDVFEKKNNNWNTKKESIDFIDYNTNKKAKMLTPYNRDSNNAITDKVQLSGTWSDNSTDVWSDKTKRGTLTFTWEGASSITSTIITMKADGTWVSDKITPPDATTAVISMELLDYAGNKAKVNENFFVSSNDPELLRITTLENDGSFKAGDTIHIVLEFNKAVAFSYGDTEEEDQNHLPSLTLNVPASGTKRTVNYSSGNGETQHVFDYVVQAGDDISALEVTAITLNGNKWQSEVNNKKFEVKNMAVPSSAANKLTGSRTIIVDTVRPTIQSITAITGTGSYNKDKEIFIQATFSEEVTIQTPANLKLNLNTGKTSTKTIKTGPQTVLFTYKIGEGENTPGSDSLIIDSVTYNTAGIKDIAGNALNSGATNKELAGIKVDTDQPGKPVITGFASNICVYESAGVTFTITNIATDAVKKQYSTNGGTTWIDYSKAVTLDQNGTYEVKAMVTDAAGNYNISDTKIVSIDKGDIITSVSANVPTGTYTTGKVINIMLNFRKGVKVAAGSTLTMNNGKTATLASAANTAATQLIYEYEVRDGDSSNGLNVETITGTFTDEKGTPVNDYIIGKIPSGKNLLDSRTIKIVTGRPIVTAAALSTVNGKDTLTITFSSPISKSTGNITLEQTSGYKAPSVISQETFTSYKLNNPGLADYYTLGTNGSDVNGNSDLTEKYVLNYATETTDTSLITILKAANADKVIIPVNSSYVVVSNDKLVITLSDSYSVPVKGAQYTVKLPESLVKNKQNRTNPSDETKLITHTGLEEPVVRVNKHRETVGATISQPTTSEVKVDCQTPGATVSSEVFKMENNPVTIGSSTATTSKVTYNLQRDNTIDTSTNVFVIGGTDTTKGYIYRINATASKGGSSVTAYEFAYRSVYTVTNLSTDAANDMCRSETNYQNLWVRGSDKTLGGMNILSFPVSWDTSQFDKIRAMTKTGTNSWYWISWEINTPAYLEPFRGNMPSDAATNGPSVWCYGMQGNMPILQNTPLYPGQSISVTGNVDMGAGTGFSFYNKHCEYRDGDGKVVKQKKSN